VYQVVIVSEESDDMRQLAWDLMQKGYICSAVLSPGQAAEGLGRQPADVVLVYVERVLEGADASQVALRIKGETQLPVVALISKGALNDGEAVRGIDDFVVEPWETDEVACRLGRAVSNHGGPNGQVIRCGPLVIDQCKCEVTLDARPVELTFREYELLRFLAGSRGRVFTREALLNQVWGYDYYGGDRTVDVHIRRLRSKIESSGHTFIDTVRNMGYRFKKER